MKKALLLGLALLLPMNSYSEESLSKVLFYFLSGLALVAAAEQVPIFYGIKIETEEKTKQLEIIKSTKEIELQIIKEKNQLASEEIKEKEVSNLLKK